MLVHPLHNFYFVHLQTILPYVLLIRNKFKHALYFKRGVPICESNIRYKTACNMTVVFTSWNKSPYFLNLKQIWRGNSKRFDEEGANCDKSGESYIDLATLNTKGYNQACSNMIMNYSKDKKYIRRCFCL